MVKIEDIIIQFWIIKMKNLFYAGGFEGFFSDNVDSFSYETTPSKADAKLIFIEEEANYIAEKVHGKLIHSHKKLIEISNILKNQELKI
ncbi:hypothetical protein [uncultured Clostridium sp.]|uniref:hypothetical protein n=1 Tax=uncultured Clostridium sp. TaxID=59620 RepID=UPI0028EF2FE2|nr:hypothetical protein [uncultured Clostridium sp.]